MTTTISWSDLEGLVDVLRAAHPRVDPRALDDGELQALVDGLDGRDLGRTGPGRLRSSARHVALGRLMAEPAVLDPMKTAALDEGWIRAVLFDHAIDDWVDLGPDPIRRQHVGQIYADHVAAAYGAWKWLCDRAGTDIDTPPAAQPAADALALETGVTDWTELMVALFTVGRAQSLLFADLASTGDEARRAFDRVSRDLAGHAALAYLELRRATFVDPRKANACLERMLPAARSLLTDTGLGDAFELRLQPLLESLVLQ